MRGWLIALTLLALLASCGDAPGTIREFADDLEQRLEEQTEEPDDGGTEPLGEPEGEGSGDEEEVPSGAPPPDGGDGGGGDGEPSRPSEEQGTAEETRPDEQQRAFTLDDAGPVGVNGRAVLRGEVARLVIEVDVQEGVRADGPALDHLQRVLAREADKPGGIDRAQRGFSSDRGEWKHRDVVELADRRRQHRSGDDQAAIYVAYLRGSYERSDAIGVAVNASVFAVFPDQWRGTVETLVGSSRAVERAVLVHEAGHLLGLVELTYDSRHDRHDDEHPGHSTNRGSVMHWAIATSAVGQVFDGPPPDDFDEADRDDLRFLRTGSR